MESQIKSTHLIEEIANSVNGNGKTLVINLKNKVLELIQVIPYGNNSKEQERNIRCRRTAYQIFEDKYVYHGKACTDLVIAFLGLANAKGIESKFVKIYNEKYLHSVAEVKINGQWYICDVSPKRELKPGRFNKSNPIDNWYLWKKGRDSWDIGLRCYEDKQKIIEEVNQRFYS